MLLMDPHVASFPRKVLIGSDCLDSAADVVFGLGFRRPLLLSDTAARQAAGNRVAASLSSMRPPMEMMREPSVGESLRIAGALRGRDVILAIGGGSVIDVAKLAAHRAGVPWISVPTAPSHDGIASSGASLLENGSKRTLMATPPEAVIADVGVLSSAPARLVRSGYADVVSNLTSVQDWKLARDDRGEYYSESAARLALLSADLAMESADLVREGKERGIRNLVQSLLISGVSMSLAGSSRPASGSEHAFSHALDRLGAGALHGEQCGLGAILMARWQGLDWASLRDGLRRGGAPVTASAAGMGAEQVIRALLDARTVRDRYTILDRRPLDRQGALELCRLTGVL
jgi:glycerol-1-phosphate dehydrogenase [NAD(P)+]